jgi:6-pyruvoyltetrahydropterin/6-carboxytetrahydropterin synthase
VANIMTPKISLARRAYFSCARQLRHPDWSDEQNQAAFGKDALPHGHDYVLDVFYQGEIGAQDGMIVNLTDIKPILARVLDQLDGKFLDGDVEYFATRRPTAENIVNFIWSQLPEQIGAGRLVRVLLQESARLSVEKTANTMKLTRCYEFAAAHRLHVPQMSQDDNSALYGKCNNPRGHGHNYGLEVTSKANRMPKRAPSCRCMSWIESWTKKFTNATTTSISTKTAPNSRLWCQLPRTWRALSSISCRRA